MKNLPRMYEWFILACALSAFVFTLKPELMSATVYKLSLITSAAWLGYWLDRRMFPNFRPHELCEPIERAAANLRRALVVSAAMLAVALGL